MNAIPYDRPEEEWDSYEEGTQEEQDEFALPGRPRRQWFNKKSAALFAVVLAAVGFYAGVRVEKNQLSNSSSTAGAFTGAGTAARQRALPRPGGPAPAARRRATGATGAAGPGIAGPALPRAVAASAACSAAVPVAPPVRARHSAPSAASAATIFTSRKPRATR